MSGKTIFLSAAAFLLLGAGPVFAADKAPTETILILDASGSMLGKIGGRTKMAIAREVIGDLVRNMDPSTRLGLTVYGHRKRSSCRDIEALVPVSELDADSFMRKVNALTPMGKTPLSRAVKQAAEDLRYTEKKASIILVSDGRESCDMDPCAVSRELEKAGLDFTVHVIGFDVEDELGLSDLRCIAKNTGGEFFSAKDAPALKKALGVAVRRVVNDKNNVVLTAIAKKGAKPSRDARWYVYPVDAGGKPAKKYLAFSSYNPGALTLPAGRYLAKVTIGKGTAEARFTVKADEKTEKTVIVGVGDVILTAVQKKGAKPSRDARWYVYPIGPGGKPAKKYLAYSSYNPGTLTLPAGRYLAKVTVGKGTAEARFTVKADEKTAKTVIVGVGEVVLAAIAKKGAKPTRDARWYVYPIGPGGKPAKKYLAYSGYNPGTLTLPAGRYLAKVTVGKGAVEARFTVKADEKTNKTVVVDVGDVVLSAVAKKGGKPSGDARWWVYPVGGDGKPAKKYLAYSGYNPGVLTLPAGRYHVRGSFGNVKKEAEFTVRADETTKVEIPIR